MHDVIPQILSSGIAKEFKCAQVWDGPFLRKMLDYDRQRSLLGLEEMVAPGLRERGFDYVVSSKATVLGDDYENATIYLSTKIMNSGKSRFVAGADARFRLSSRGETIEALNGMIKKLNEDLAYMQLCPYMGTLKITSRTKGKMSEEDQHYVTCNGGDSLYKKTKWDDRSSVVEWKALKTGLIRAEVDVDYQQRQDQLMVEEDGCHRCKSGRYGPHSTRETRKEQTDIVTRGADGTAKLTFNRNGTYTLSLKLASPIVNGREKTADGTTKETIERVEEGTCDVAAPYRGEVRRKVSFSFVDQTIPGVGTPFDKHIAFRPPPVVLKSDFPSEETVIEAEIDLSRK